MQDEVDPTPDAFIEKEEMKRDASKKKGGTLVAASNVGTLNPDTSIAESIFSQTITEEGFTSIDENTQDDQSQAVQDEARETGMQESEDSDDGLNAEPEKQKKLKGPYFR